MCVRPRGHKLLVVLFGLHMIGRIIAAAFQFRFMALAIDVIDRRDPEMRRQLQPNKTNIIPLYSSKRRSSHPSLQMR